jgi:hypothetical protein
LEAYVVSLWIHKRDLENKAKVFLVDSDSLVLIIGPLMLVGIFLPKLIRTPLKVAAEGVLILATGLVVLRLVGLRVQGIQSGRKETLEKLTVCFKVLAGSLIALGLLLAIAGLLFFWRTSGFESSCRGMQRSRLHLNCLKSVHLDPLFRRRVYSR